MENPIFDALMDLLKSGAIACDPLDAKQMREWYALLAELWAKEVPSDKPPSRESLPRSNYHQRIREAKAAIKRRLHAKAPHQYWPNWLEGALTQASENPTNPTHKTDSPAEPPMVTDQMLPAPKKHVVLCGRVEFSQAELQRLMIDGEIFRPIDVGGTEPCSQ